MASYEFKYKNITLKTYRQSLMAKAAGLRRESELLIAKAETIEVFAAQLEVDLVEKEDGKA